MVNHDIATVREFMFCTWSQIRLFLKLIKKKFEQPRQVLPTELPQNIESPLLSPSLLKFQKKLPPLTCPVWNPGPPFKKWAYSRACLQYADDTSLYYCTTS